MPCMHIGFTPNELVQTFYSLLYKVTNIQYFHIEIRKQILLSTLYMKNSNS